MNSERIEHIQSSGYQACMVVAGGGVGAVHALLVHPGASRLILDVQIPYSREAMEDFIGSKPPSYCSAETVEMLAKQALKRAEALGAKRPLGIACTAALKTNIERDDADRAFICFLTREKNVIKEMNFLSGTRLEQENSLKEMCLAQLAEFVVE